MKTCTEWNELNSIEATCPYCETSTLYHGSWADNDIVRCTNPKCKKQFKLGEQE